MKILTGLLNSRLLQYLYENHFATIDVLKNALLALPLPLLPVEAGDNTPPRRMADLVDRMLVLHEKLRAARISQEKSIIQHQIEATGRQIDRIAYGLYGLTEGEIAVVEGG